MVSKEASMAGVELRSEEFEDARCSHLLQIGQARHLRA
jgi:hypothetical protein